MQGVLADQVVDLVVLDLKLRGEDGMALARRLRDESEIPILMLTGRVEEADRVMGLELGADDYLTKPFSLAELLARVKALLRRADLLRAAHVERAEAFVLATDDAEQTVRIARLLRRQYPNLKIFARARNRQHAFKLMDLGVHVVVRETLHSSLEMGQRAMEVLGVPHDVAFERRERFREHDEAMLRETAMLALGVVGLESLAAVRADRLQHSELRFIEIARALMLDPDFLLLDEPAAGLSNDEIERLAGLIKAISARGTGVLLVEHHADLIFDICHQVTVLNLGRTLAAGTPAEIRQHREVINAYLGG